ncbi:hypothetical protein CPB85DRAFT_728326 [Mucidula mucida]|nr:hypothetical protein CPB85DRAFT_728326 [Mucidula mucida]
MSYSFQGQYLPPPHYHHSSSSSSSLSSGHEPVYAPHAEVPTAPPQQEQALQRKRPKYTRSKTGCMTCRQKKIKCDESKPACVRCTHSQRNCTWPEGIPVRKRVPQRRDSLDDRPSTAGSSVSDESSPSLRNVSPPRRLDPEVGLLPPLIPRRNPDPYLQLPPVMPQESGSDRRHMSRPPFAQGMHSAATMHSMSEINTYSTSHHYDYSHHPREQNAPPPRAPVMATGVRALEHQGYWNSSSLLPPIDAYHYPAMQERGIVGVPDHHRYQ